MVANRASRDRGSSRWGPQSQEGHRLSPSVSPEQGHLLPALHERESERHLDGGSRGFGFLSLFWCFVLTVVAVAATTAQQAGCWRHALGGGGQRRDKTITVILENVPFVCTPGSWPRAPESLGTSSWLREHLLV